MPITEQAVINVGKNLYTRALKVLPCDVLDVIRAAAEKEDSPLAKVTLETIIKNAVDAQAKNKVLCQDTCIGSYYVKIGTRARLSVDIEKALEQATREVTTQLPIIPHCVHPVTRQNTGTGTGPGVPILRYGVVYDADYLEIAAQPVEGGGDILSTTKTFSSLSPFSEVKKFIIETIAAAGSRPCPPMIVGIGIGGMFESVTALAKDAVERPLNVRNQDKVIAAMEEELLGYANRLGIGPMGLGGKTTCLALNIEISHTQTVLLPVAIKINCWCLRRATARIYNDGRIEYL